MPWLLFLNIFTSSYSYPYPILYPSQSPHKNKTKTKQSAKEEHYFQVISVVVINELFYYQF